MCCTVGGLALKLQGKSMFLFEVTSCGAGGTIAKLVFPLFSICNKFCCWMSPQLHPSCCPAPFLGRGAAHFRGPHKKMPQPLQRKWRGWAPQAQTTAARRKPWDPWTCTVPLTCLAQHWKIGLAWHHRFTLWCIALIDALNRPVLLWPMQSLLKVTLGV